MFESIFAVSKEAHSGPPYIYEQGFTNYNMGYASALAWIFFALIMIVTLGPVSAVNRGMMSIKKTTAWHVRAQTISNTVCASSWSSSASS